LLLLLCCLESRQGFAQANTEEIQVGRILQCLQVGGSDLFTRLFAPYDTVLSVAQKFTDPNPNEVKKVQNLMAVPQKLQQFDPVYNQQMITDFDAALKKGKDSGLHWTDMTMARYELEKMILPRELVGLTKIMSLRMRGYIFVEDMLTRRRYLIEVSDVYTLQNKWYGGRIVNVLEAETIDEYLEKRAAEKKMAKEKLLAEMYGTGDPSDAVDTTKAIVKKNTDDEDDNEEEQRRDVIERKYYTGTFDNETKVELYVRGLKGPCPETVCSWEAMYRFQDMDDYIKLEVTRGPDGSWIFNEEPEVGVMELKLGNEKFTGTWMSLKDKTEYEVNLEEKKEVKGKKLFKMDYIIENDLYDTSSR
jgi:hypothetical protein